MDIYFCGSIRGGRSDADLYGTLIGMLETHGTVLTEHVGNDGVETEEAGTTDGEIYEQDIAWLERADVVVAEVTVPSLGVGYEIAKATEWNKPVLCLYRPDGEHDLSAMIRGNDEIRVTEYHDPANLEPVFAEFVGK